MDDSQKIAFLCSRFDKLGLGSRSYQTMDMINKGLDNMINEEFDREVSEQIFEQCNPDNYKGVQVENFCKIIVTAENILQKKKVASQNQLQEYEEKNNQCMQQLNMARRQKINKYAISEESVLNVDCLQAKNLRTNSQVFVILKLGQQMQQVGPMNSISPQNPQWGQTVNLQVLTGQEQLIIEVYNISNVLIGSANLLLKELFHQQMIQSWLKLSDQNYQETGEIEVALQFIHNKAQYYEDLMKKIELMKEQVQVDLDDYERDIQTIQKLFGDKKAQSYINTKPIGHMQSKIKSDNLLQVGYQDVQANKQSPVGMQSSKLKESQISQPPTVDGCIQPSEEIKYFFLCGGLIIFFSLLESLVKPAQTDFILGSLIILIFWIDCFEQKFIRKVGVFTLVTLILDLSWCKIYSSGWWDSSSYVDEAKNLEGLYRLAVVCVIITFFIKIVMLYFLYKIDQTLTQEPNNKYCFIVAEEIFIFGKKKRNPIFDAYVADANKQTSNEVNFYISENQNYH